MTPQAHRELDYAVAVHVFGIDRPPAVIDAFSSRLEQAWKVHRKACSWLRSRRLQYYAQMRIITSELCKMEPGTVVDWPEVLTLARDCLPEVICRAALAVANPQPAPARPARESGNLGERRGMLGRDL